jgi:cyanophycinase
MVHIGTKQVGLDLLPGAIVVAGVSLSDAALLKPTPRFGLSFSPDTGLLIRKRRLWVIGNTTAKVILPAGGGKPREEVEFGGPAPVDFISLRRRAVERSLPVFPAARQSVPKVKSGALVIAGGGGMPRGLAERFVELAGGPDAPIVYVPCEEEEELPDPMRDMEMFRRAGATNITWIHTKDRNRANTDEKVLGPLRTAKGIWFGGGRQWNLADSYLDTEAQELMKQALERGGVIGGSSAGASVQSEYMARGNPLGNLDIMAAGYERGLGFIRGVAIDQHFTARRRHKDMTQLVMAYPQLLGIGLDEATAIIVRGSMAEVTGRGSVFFFDAKRPHKEGEPDYETAPSGSTYDLAKRKLTLNAP